MCAGHRNLPFGIGPQGKFYWYVYSLYAVLRRCEPSVQVLESEFYRSAKFVDDYWLAIALASRKMATSPQLLLLSTEQTTTGGATPVRTIFNFDPLEHLDLEVGCLHLELGGHKPSREESLFASFYPDTSQRILAVKFRNPGSIFVVRTEILIRMSQERGDTTLQWEQWKAHGIEIRPGDVITDLWVSGPRLFCMCGEAFHPEGTRMDVYDFSPQVSAKHLETTTDGGGRVQRYMWSSIRKYRPPWKKPVVHFANGGHDSIILFMVSLPRSTNLTRI